MRIKSLLITAVLATAILGSANIVKATCMDENFSQKTDAEKIQCLTTIISDLNNQITALGAPSGPNPTACDPFTKTFAFGATDTATNGEVTKLQYALTRLGFNLIGDKSGTFGVNTRLAVIAFQGKIYTRPVVIAFQKKYGLPQNGIPQNQIQQTGRFDTQTQAKLNSILGCDTGTPSPEPNPNPTSPTPAAPPVKPKPPIPPPVIPPSSSVICDPSSISILLRPSIASVTPSSGSTDGGYTVIIRGSNFTAQTMISFGDFLSDNVFADFIGVEDNGHTIKVTAPPHGIGWVNVYVWQKDIPAPGKEKCLVYLPKSKGFKYVDNTPTVTPLPSQSESPAPLPSGPDLQSPKDGAGINGVDPAVNIIVSVPIFKWDPIIYSNATTYYQLQVATDLSFNPSFLVIDKTIRDNNSVSINNISLSNSTIYFWRVRAYSSSNSSIQTDWSYTPPWSFKTIARQISPQGQGRASITITSPTEGQTIVGKAGTSFPVLWTTQNINTNPGVSTGYVNIYLVDSNNIAKIVRAIQPNNGVSSININSNYTTSATYKVRVSTITNTAVGESGNFTIIPPFVSLDVSQDSLSSISDALLKIAAEVQAMQNQ